jgi:phosphomannomutase
MFVDYELDITVALGGSTSFDIYPNGWDKTYVLRHLEEFKNVYFVGDRCKDGGNDKALYDVLRKTNTSFETESPKQTMEIIENIINENKHG